MHPNRRAMLLAAVPAWPALATGIGRAATNVVEAEAVAARLSAGRVVLLLRHATTDPGVGDPPGFRPGDCATQRNLSADGRTQAQRLGAWFRDRSLVPAAVRSSAWCRCLDTARLAFGSVAPWPALDSFFGEAAQRERQTAALASALGALAPGRFEVWVTHQVNITALTGAFAEMGDGALVDAEPGWPARARVIARFAV